LPLQDLDHRDDRGEDYCIPVATPPAPAPVSISAACAAAAPAASEVKEAKAIKGSLKSFFFPGRKKELLQRLEAKVAELREDLRLSRAAADKVCRRLPPCLPACLRLSRACGEPGSARASLDRQAGCTILCACACVHACVCLWGCSSGSK
jgi:hypothetical protein